MTSTARSFRRRSRRPGALELIPIDLPNGQRALYVGDPIRESDPPAVREGIARRRVLALTGKCPCGAVSPFDPSRISPALVMEVIEHESECPATDENMIKALRAARGGIR